MSIRNEVSSTLVENVKALCLKKKITIAGLEREVGLSNGAIRHWDKSSPTLASLQKIAKFFKVPISRLIKGVE